MRSNGTKEMCEQLTSLDIPWAEAELLYNTVALEIERDGLAH